MCWALMAKISKPPLLYPTTICSFSDFIQERPDVPIEHAKVRRDASRVLSPYAQGNFAPFYRKLIDTR